MRRVFPSVPESVAEAVHLAEESARAAGLSDEVVDRVVLATGEAAANAVEHGSANQIDGSFEMTWSEEQGGVWLRIEDAGPGIDPTRLARAELPEDPLSTSGRGLYLIRTLADEARVEAGGRRVALWFARAQM